MKKGRKNIQFIQQLNTSDCGAACLTMIAKYYDRRYDIDDIKSLFEFSRIGASLKDIEEASYKIGLKCYSLKVSINELEEFEEPVILYWKQEHFVVFDRIIQKDRKKYFILFDPSYGKIKIEEEDFIDGWVGNNNGKGILLYIEPSENIIDKNNIKISEKGKIISSTTFKEGIKYIENNKKYYFISCILIGIGVCINLGMPFIFQNIIDKGVLAKKIEYVVIFLCVQLLLSVSNFISELLSQIILTKLNLGLSINFKQSLLEKLMRLPISFFEARLNTEILQRIGDQNTIQNFLTWKGIELILNSLHIIIFGGILFFFSTEIFIIYIILSSLSILWTLFFMRERKNIEYSLFLKKAQNSNNMYEFISNISEIKVNNAQSFIINKILQIQERIKDIEIKSINLNIYQLFGVNFISKLKEIISISICAYFIIDDRMSIGTLMSISYIMGQLSSPINSMVGFIKHVQDMSIATKRIEEIYENREENMDKERILNYSINQISIKDVSFKYPGSFNPLVLQNLNLSIKKNTTTAIVGTSGSGKTTLIKLLLSYYSPTEGHIYIDNQNLNLINPNEWRDCCGSVLQEGKIFSGTIKENIALSKDDVDYEKLEKATKLSCISDFIEGLPMKYDTKIGSIGIPLSGGQKQRLLIARAVYRNSQVLFLDEATSSLDAENEKNIHDNLQKYFQGKTVVVIAHRLSTVKNADNIVVLKKGKVIEQGTHNELVNKKGEYFNLIKNQLELDN